MAKTEADIIAFLKAQADSIWQSEGQPFLLSQATPGLKGEEIDYREILGEERLKAFVKRTEQNGGYRLVSHPHQKAKVGIVPSDAQFEFPIDVGSSEDDRGATSPHGNTKSDYSPRAFLRALSKLTDEELDQIVIPTKIFIKLLGGR